MLVVDLIERGEPRIFPYAGNVPAMRAILSRPTAAGAPAEPSASCLEPGEIERIVLALLTEVLRSLIWRPHAEAVVARALAAGHPDILGANILYFVRVPELLDVAHLRISGKRDMTIVYPDPPLDEHERPLIEAVSEGMRFRALSELEVTR